MIKKLLGYKAIYGPFLLVAVIVGGLYLLQSYRSNSAPTPTKAAAPLSDAQFDSQANKLSSLMEHQGIKAAFAYVTKEVQVDPSFATSCHPLLHTLGHAAYNYYGSYQQAIKYQNEICNSGYTHGVLEAYLAVTPDIKQAIATACGTSTDQNFAQWQCFHGLGHGIMIAGNEKISPSIKLCQTLPSTFSVSACANGVFMEHFVIEAHNGTIPTVNPTGLNDCVNQEDIYKPDCYLYAPTAYLTIYEAQYKSALKWCGGAEKNYIAMCVAGVGSQSMKDNINNPSVAKQVCLESSKQYRNSCVSGAVEMYIFDNASSVAAEKLCYNEFANYQSTCQATINGAKDSLQT